MPNKDLLDALTPRELAIQRAMTEAQGPFADPTRAAEIALMDKFGLAEFTELTGVGIGDYGIYRVARTGISVRTSESLADFMASHQNTILQAERTLTLGFRCTPAEFLAWYDATRGAKIHPQAPPGERPASDFPLAEGFLETLRPGEGVTTAENSVPAPKIILAFRVKESAAENKKWWDDRMRSAIKYKLKHARVSRGRAKNPSRWDLLQVAVWLIEKSHLPEKTVRATVAAHFPEVDTSHL